MKPYLTYSDITYKSELILDIRDVKDLIRPEVSGFIKGGLKWQSN